MKSIIPICPAPRLLSPRACGAWIEIKVLCALSEPSGCRPALAGRGLKLLVAPVVRHSNGSPRACGAWIEICCTSTTLSSAGGRPALAGRGLKCLHTSTAAVKKMVAPRLRGVD